jgi:hypothetical protein
MEINEPVSYIYPEAELDRHEGRVIEELKANSLEPIPDPDGWLDEDIKQNVLLTTADWLINWGRRSSPWVSLCFPACCAFEFIASMGPRFDISRFGMESARFAPRRT